MKRLTCILAILACVSSCSETESAWLRPPPQALGGVTDWIVVDETAFFEVPVSKLEAAEHALADVSVIPRDQGQGYFGRSAFVCEPPRRVYLVRAQYMNGGTGGFTLYWASSRLVVSHFSLGGASPVKKSALVACLAQKPLEVFGGVGAAL
jgi:hypothetical protein